MGGKREPKESMLWACHDDDDDDDEKVMKNGYFIIWFTWDKWNEVSLNIWKADLHPKKMILRILWNSSKEPNYWFVGNK